MNSNKKDLITFNKQYLFVLHDTDSENNEIVGKIFTKNRKLVFEGECEKSAKLFFNACIQMFNSEFVIKEQHKKDVIEAFNSDRPNLLVFTTGEAAERYYNETFNQ